MKHVKIKAKALAWFESLTEQQKDRLQYELPTERNYLWWGDNLKVALYKKIKLKNNQKHEKELL
jgi:hypothetical protein